MMAPNKKRKPLVTLIVGMICKRGIALAADSQTTYGFTKIPGTNKITPVRFKNGKEVLIAEAGMVVLAGQVISIFSEKAAQADLTSRDTVPALLNEAMMEVRTRQQKLYPEGHSLQEWKALFRDESQVELTAAYYFEDKPYLLTMTLDECVAHFVKDFSVSGCGANFALYFFKQYFAPDMDRDLGLAMTIKIARDSAVYVEGCGLPIKAAICRQSDSIVALYDNTSAGRVLDFEVPIPESISILSEAQVNSTIEMIDRIEAQTSESRMQNLHAALKAEAHSQFQKMFPFPKGWNFPKD